MAAKCFIPYAHEDGIVTRVPSQENIQALQQRLPHTDVCLDVAPGQRLGDLLHQDSFCYQLGTLYITGNNHEEIEENYKFCLDFLDFEIEKVDL